MGLALYLQKNSRDIIQNALLFFDFMGSKFMKMDTYSAFFNASESETFPILLYSSNETAVYASSPKISIFTKTNEFTSSGIHPDIFAIIMDLNRYFKIQ